MFPLKLWVLLGNQSFTPSSCLVGTELMSLLSTLQEAFELPHKDLSFNSHLGESESPVDSVGEKCYANLEHLFEVTCDWVQPSSDTRLVWKFALLIIVCACLSTQSRSTPCNPMGCSLLGSSVHGIFQARILERVAISPWDLPNAETEPESLASPALAVDCLSLTTLRKP